MLRTSFLKKPQFGIRAILFATVLVAGCSLVWRERTRYLREHFFVNVVDQQTGGLLPRFQYQTSVITNKTGEDETWSEWLEHPKQSTLTLKIPEFCKLQFRARSIDVAGGYSQQYQSMLVMPHLSHNATLRMTEGNSFQSFLIESITREPICGARIVPVDLMDSEEDVNSAGIFQHRAPYFDSDFETFSDSKGKFVVRNLGKGFAIIGKTYQSKVVRFDNASEEDLAHWRNNGIPIERAVKIHGRVTCRVTGDPIKECDVVCDNKLFRATSEFGGQFGPLSIQERNDFNLVTKTDDSGCFELFADSDIENDRVCFYKKGWCKEAVKLSECEDDITLEPWPFELAGMVVDESGDPIPEFQIKTFFNWNDVDTERFHCADGAFRIRANSEIAYFEVYANNKAIFSKKLDWNWPEAQPNELVVLTDGVEVVGSVIGYANGTGTGQFDVQVEFKRFPSHAASHLMQHSGDTRVASMTTQPNGSFRFNNIADGSYKLVTTYFGQVINARPIVVDKLKVLVDPIALPPLGRIRFKVRNEVGADAPFHRTYITDQLGEPRKWFHTDHRGEFELENVPCGWYGIGPKPARLHLLSCGYFGWSIDGAILVEPARTTEFSYEDVPLFDLHGLYPLTARQVDASGSKQLTSHKLDFAMTCDKPIGTLSAIQLTSQSRATDQDAFHLSLTQGPCQQHLKLVYRASFSGRPNPILFRARQLQLNCSDTNVRLEKTEHHEKISEHKTDALNDDPFGSDVGAGASALQSELYAGRTTVFLLKQNRVISEIHSIGLQDIIPYYVHDEDPDSAIIHNTRFGWSRINLRLQHDSGPGVYDLTLKDGAAINGKVNLVALPLMPLAVRILDEQAVSLTCPIKEDGTFEFKEIWPGKWRLQMLGYDPYLGERILAVREWLCEGIDSHDLEFGVSNSLDRGQVDPSQGNELSTTRLTTAWAIERRP